MNTRISHSTNLEAVKYLGAPLPLRWFLLMALFLAMSGAMFGQASANPGASGPYIKKAVDRGIAVEASIEPVDPAARGRAFREGDSATFRFRFADATTNQPLQGAYPIAWMALNPDGRTPKCTELVQGLLNSNFLSRPELELNSYYVLAMNDDATISVVDPLFGYGNSKLLTLLRLDSPAEDWALSSDGDRLFVSTPDTSAIVVIDTRAWKIIGRVELPGHPGRIGLQPDGSNVWVALDGPLAGATESGVVAISTTTLKTAARITTGKGAHAMAFSSDSRYLAVTNAEDGTVSLIALQSLSRLKQLHSGGQPVSIVFSLLSQMFYVSNRAEGTILVFEPKEQREIARIQAEPGLGQIKAAPRGRLVFVVNPERSLVHIIDSASNQMVQTAPVEKGPDQIVFSDKLAYIRHRDSETVLMVPLEISGGKGKLVSLVDFPGGQHPFGKVSRPSPADGFAQAPGENAMLVANAADKAIYYYQEGMAAPMGSFSNFGREPRAILVVDRSLRQRAPGVYETTAQLPHPGSYSLALLVDSPRVVQCFPVLVESNPDLENHAGVKVEFAKQEVPALVGHSVHVHFLIADGSNDAPRPNLQDVRVLAILEPGTWHDRLSVTQEGNGVYGIDFTPPATGSYVFAVESPSVGLSFNRSPKMRMTVVADNTSH
jgi:DNA-binding beta-propeller fold protein YncE